MLRHSAIFATVVMLATGAFVTNSALRAQQPASVADGVYTDAQAARGHAAYSNDCAACHGATLGGNGEAPALTGGQFISDWTGLTLADLFQRVHATMPQDNPGSLSSAQYADILAFILKENGYPSGSKELDHRSEYLKAVAFVVPPTPGPASANK